VKISQWENYELLDCSNGERLERWNDIILVRPDPQVIWKTPKLEPHWNLPHAKYFRSKSGGGSWKFLKDFKRPWQICYKDLKFTVNTMGFKHTGVFPEQAANWDLIRKLLVGRNNVNVLNLFAYTGGATLACAKAGAFVCHVDSAKSMVRLARENALNSGLLERKIRWIVDDCRKFLQREIKRGVKYDAIIMDPPSYGKGPSGEVWNLESDIFELILCGSKVLSNKPLFFMLNSYTSGISCEITKCLLEQTINKVFSGTVEGYELGIKVKNVGISLHSGSTSVWINRKLGFDFCI
jgi:23S rRNA (cytosine1962-C5)-methyltransferase